MVTIEQVLEEQTKTPLLVTVEAIEGKPEAVKVTPWSPIGGCNCSLSLELDKGLIEGVISTQMRHACCGQTFLVVELQFKDGASIGLRELVEQFVKRANEPRARHVEPRHSMAIPPSSAMTTQMPRMVAAGIQPTPLVRRPSHQNAAQQFHTIGSENS